MQKRGPWTVCTSDCVYDNPWISVFDEKVLNPKSKPGVYGRVHFKNRALAVVALDDKSRICLVGQHRYPLDIYTWELPEGGGPHSEDSLAAIQRELKEEAGVEATDWTLLAKDLQVSNSVSDELLNIYLARGLHLGENAPEETEELTVNWVDFSECLKMIQTGEIVDLISVTALLLTNNYLSISS